MDAEGNDTSLDERIAGAFIGRVIQEELREGRLDGQAPALQGVPEPQSARERSLLREMGCVIDRISVSLQNNPELHDCIDGMVSSPGTMKEKFLKLAGSVLEDGVSWEKVFTLIYVAGRLAVKVVEAQMPSLVVEVFGIVMAYFQKHLLAWVHSHGGWSNSLLELSGRMPAMPSTLNTVLIISCVAALSIIIWKMMRRA